MSRASRTERLDYLKDQLRKRVVILDGAMGTQLQLRGLTTEQKPVLAAFIMPDVLTAVHRDYARAGADFGFMRIFVAPADNHRRQKRCDNSQ